jgi:hypothetical protein
MALAALVLGPACYNLPHVDPGPRWIDQFNRQDGSAALAPPTWTVFSPWTCGTIFTGTPDAGQVETDGGIVDAGIDAGQPTTACPLGPGDSTNYTNPPDVSGLEAPFDFSDSRNDFGFAVSTQATSGTVNFTGFHYLQFSAILTIPLMPLPSGIVFQVELGCSKNFGETVITQEVTELNINAQSWHRPPFRLDLSQFGSALVTSNGSCLSQIDTIRFVVIPGMDQPEVIGTLSLDNISLQN